MKTKVAIHQAEFFAFHGYYEEERSAGNTFLIDAEVVFQGKPGSTDHLENTVNYELLYRLCKEEMSRTKKLLEAVAQSIVLRMKTEIPEAMSGRVRIEKIAPQLGGKVGKAVVELEY